MRCSSGFSRLTDPGPFHSLREGEAPAEPDDKLGTPRRLGRSLALPNLAQIRE